MSHVGVSGLFHIVHRGPDGRRLWGRMLKNAPTMEGIDGMQNAMFRGGPRPATWYCRLISAAGFVGVSVNDTHASHPDWQEYTGVFGSVGVAWDPTPMNGGFSTSLTPTTIQIIASGNVQGVFLASRAAVGTASGHTIYATAASDDPLAVVAGGTLTIEYSSRLRTAGG